MRGFLNTEFDALVAKAWPTGMPEKQRRDMRWCFMAGAHAIVNKLPTILDPGDKETGRDMAIMETINQELTDVQNEIAAACGTEGNA
jgi:hypothetical protein